MKKIYITIESDTSPEGTLDKTLNLLQNVKGVTFAKGHVGMTGKPRERRYSLEKLFSGRQPSDYR
jgi:hypothetical protein